MDSILIEAIGLAAYMVMNESEELIYKGYIKDKRAFEFESSKTKEFWANRYDQIVMRLRNLKK